jgi:GNAT superfamily N-acetyltransferase
MRYSIRFATAGDARPMAVLGMQVWLDNYAKRGIPTVIADYVLEAFTPDQMARQIAASGSVNYVVEHEGNLVGMALLALGRTTPHCGDARQVEIERLYVQEPFCGAGIGAGLLTRIERDARDKNVDALWLTTWIGNTRARDFYPKAGFIDVGATYFALGDERHENRVFAKSLR